MASGSAQKLPIPFQVQNSFAGALSICMTNLFLCYPSSSRSEINALADELRLRGVRVWLDHERGFTIGDNCATEARRVILDPSETWGLLFYATPEALSRDFIRRIELESALRRKEADSNFVLTVLTRGLSFGDLSKLSLAHLGEDLSVYHSGSIQETDAEDLNERPLRPQLAKVAHDVLTSRLKLWSASQNSNDYLGLNFCTRDALAPSPDDWLDINATSPRLEEKRARNPHQFWQTMCRGLLDIKSELRALHAVPRLRIRGSKHLTGAFILGRVFPPATVREIAVQQGEALWSSCEPTFPPSTTYLDSRLVDEGAKGESLWVEISLTDQSVREAVRRFRATLPLQTAPAQLPMASLRFQPKDGLKRGFVRDGAMAAELADEIRRELLKAVVSRPVREIHLFGALPQGLMLLLGHHFPPHLTVNVYEYDGANYHHSIRITPQDIAN